MPDPTTPPSRADYPDLLRRAADLTRMGWNRHRSGLDRDGNPCGYHSRNAVNFCVMGAVYRVALDALGGQRTTARTTAFRHTVNQLTRYLALALPRVVDPDTALRFEADDPEHGIEFRLMTWNETAATQDTAVAALEAAADLAEQDAEATSGCRLTGQARPRRDLHDTAAYAAWISPRLHRHHRELTDA